MSSVVFFHIPCQSNFVTVIHNNWASFLHRDDDRKPNLFNFAAADKFLYFFDAQQRRQPRIIVRVQAFYVKILCLML